MKKLIFTTALMTGAIFCFSQENAKVPLITKDKSGITSSVVFPDSLKDSEVPSSSNAFFKEFLKVTLYDEFKEVTHKEKNNFKHERFDQYYKGIKVDDAEYSFHYKNGKMFFAQGHFVKIDDLDVTPKISPEEAKVCFTNYKAIPIETIIAYTAKLIIKEIPLKDSLFTPKLVYSIFLEADHDNNSEIGFVDAQSCGVLMTEPILTSFSATGTFATRYSGSRQGITQYYSGQYHLADSTRGAIIHTWNLNNTTNLLNRAELSDNNNNWTTAEHGPTENDMGLDVHWSIQEIWDWLHDTHGVNSYDDAGFPIDAYIRYGSTIDERDNAFWDLARNVLYFGDGVVDFRPVASIDAVGHEFGHGISDLQVGWLYAGDRAAFHEGMSDIWGVIFENRVRPNSIWQIGEQITINDACLRNLQNTNDPNAMQPIADTYLSTQYNNGNNYVRSGVLSHWFYLLVNGGSGTNGIGNAYKVYGVGMDMAEDLIIEAVYNNFLNGVTTYPGLRTSFTNAARTLCLGQNSTLVNQVENAWYAVGVGTQPTQVTMSGPFVLCFSNTQYTLSNVPPSSTITWTCSNNITRVSAQGSNPCIFKGNATGSGWINATISNASCGSIIVPKNIWSGKFESTVVTGTPDVCPNSLYTYIAQVPGGHSSSYSYSWVYPSNWYNNGQYQNTILLQTPYSPQYGVVRVSITNSCGTSGYSGITVYPSYNCGGYFLIYPNPTSDELNIEINESAINAINDSLLPNLDNNEIEKSFEIRIFNSMGFLLKSTNESGLNFSIPVSDLNEGSYIIEINDGKSGYRQQFMIKR
jgi:Zn-dependent metalloprotease